MIDEWESEKQKIIASRKRALFFFSNENKLEREKYLVRQLLEGIEVDFQECELLQAEEPVDIAFRDCNFQVKEILSEGRRRYDEFRESLEKAEKAESWQDLLEEYTPLELPVSEIVKLTLERAESLAGRKYGLAEMAVLDLLCYCNLGEVCEVVSEFNLPCHAPFRSISIVSNRFRMVIYASDEAPAILASAVGVLRARPNFQLASR